ncbi:MAG: type II toxin-antitoxin system RelE/ParE family toxin [Magnetococcales bacterium]|nr:type II toxin-antitoxin system RelE/ParE family toxin [Magnetococcales bacterium]
MRFEVLITKSAARDLEELHAFITRNDAPKKAAQVLDAVTEVIERLTEFPERGAYPRELLSLGLKEFRETFFKPYRVIYRIVEPRVYILLIADGRRDLQTLLTRRLFR